MTDILDKRKQVAQQCLAVAHLARALARVNEETAGTVSDRILNIVGERTAQHMEILGDMLNGMDAVDDDEDAWLEPVFDGAHAMFADAVAKAWAAAPVPARECMWPTSMCAAMKALRDPPPAADK